MAFAMRSQLAARLFAATLLAGGFATVVATAATAQNYIEDGGSAPKASKKKKSTQTLAPAIVSGKVTTSTEIVAEKRLAPMLSAESAAALRVVASRYREIAANGGFPKVPKGTYKKGAKNKGVVALNRRLFVDGYLRREATEGDFADRVTTATVEAVTRFQRNMGLAATGLVDGPTLAALNVPVEQRIRTIETNIPRLETYGANLGERYLIVNVPSQQIEAVANGKVYSRHNAIVGRPERPTPVVMTALSDVNFNPYWNTPPSIIERDLIPKMSSGTKILEEMNIRVFQGFGGPEIDPDTVEWGSAIADEYHFRQEPGPQNAMATAKINFPSPFGIYLHDTPEKHLFKSANRFYSSGCVRVEKVELLLEWVLNGQENIGRSEIAGLAESLERKDVKLAAPPQLRVTYLTAWPVGNTVAFRPDVYDLDQTGFIVGQPMPVGEVADDGQRFVLKPIARKASAVDAAEAEGIGLFGARSTKRGTAKPINTSLYDNEDPVNNPQPSAKKKLPFGVKKAVGEEGGTVLVSAGGKKAPASKVTKTKGSKEFPGLFDWAAYRKSQNGKAAKPIKPAVIQTKKGLKPKPEAAKVAAANPTKTPVTAKPKATLAKAAEKPAKKVAAVEPKVLKTPAAKPEKTSDLKGKAKPAEADTKKVADICKPAADRKLPKGCKAPEAKKP